MDIILIGMLLIWNEARQARRSAHVAAAVATADPLSWESLERRLIDQGINSIINLPLPG